MSKTRRCRRCQGTGEEPDHVTIGANLRSSRERAGITLREMARRLGYSPPYISDRELGRRAWRPQLLRDYQKEVR